MEIRRTWRIVALGGLLAIAPVSALAQTAGGSAGPSNPSGTTSSVPGSASQPPTADAPGDRVPTGRTEGDDREGSEEKNNGPEESGRTWSVSVRVESGIDGDPVSATGVLLEASRATGPFERRSPKPIETWESVTDETGVATFSGLPGDLLGKRIEIQAVTTASGVEFESARRSPADGRQLKVSVYPRASNADNVVVERLRTVFQPWEDYLVVSQYWRLSVEGNRAVDTTMLPGDRFEEGLPIELPVAAKGIHLFGPGDSKIIDGTANWKGVLRPGEPVSLRLRFSVSAYAPTHVYRQRVDYPVENVEVVLPLQTEHRKVPRLEDATLAAKGFESVEATRRVPGFRADNEYLYATGKSLGPGEAFAVRLTGLPFERPLAPWITLGLGVVGIVLILLFARREVARLQSDDSAEAAIEALEKQRQELLDDLAELERAFDEGDLSEVTYETESLRLRERLSLIMSKLDELRETD